MDHIKRLVIAAGLSLCAVSAHAYVFPSPPPGFGGTPGNWTFAPPSGVEQLGKIMRQPGALSVPVSGGSAARLPVAYRLAPGATRVAAAVIFNHPAVRIGLGVATLLSIGKIFWDESQQAWMKTVDGEQVINPGDQYYIFNQSTLSSTKEGACSFYPGISNQNNNTQVFYNARVSGDMCLIDWHFVSEPNRVRTNETGINKIQKPCPPGWTRTPAGCVGESSTVRKIKTQEEFETELSPHDLPPTVPKELPPGIPWPVDDPVVNPTPGENPTPMPHFVPTGDPVPNPQYDPAKPQTEQNQPWLQPGVRLTPSPTLNEPWRIDPKPVDRPVTGPKPQTDEELNPKPPADPQQPDPRPPNNDKPKPEETQSLCEKHPDIVACAKMGNIGPEVVKDEKKTMEIKADTGYGPSNGTCPAPRTATVMGKSISMPFDLICDFADAIRPIVISFAWLAAAMTFFGFSRRD